MWVEDPRGKAFEMLFTRRFPRGEENREEGTRVQRATQPERVPLFTPFRLTAQL